MNERTVGAERRDYRSRAFISDLGDLHPFGAFRRLPAGELRAVAGKTYPRRLSLDEIRALDASKLYRDGYTSVETDDSPPPTGIVNGLTVHAGGRSDTSIGYGHTVDLLLYGEAGELRYAVVNGRVVEVPDR
jgi:hypothetical protein